MFMAGDAITSAPTVDWMVTDLSYVGSMRCGPIDKVMEWNESCLVVSVKCCCSCYETVQCVVWSLFVSRSFLVLLFSTDTNFHLPTWRFS